MNKPLGTIIILTLLTLILGFINTDMNQFAVSTCAASTGQAANSIDSQIDQDDEFDESITDDEFGEFEEYKKPAGCNKNSCYVDLKSKSDTLNKLLYWVFGILLVTVLAGFLVRYNSTRSLRGLFLIASIVILGFYKGACPCPISSFSNLILWFTGVNIDWQRLVWFLALIPITYLLGKVWCGWICHLGALQEFMFLPGRLNLFRGERAQKVMKTIRLLLLAVLIAQLLITKTYLFNKIDPFKVAFNLLSTNLAGWILLGLLFISSIFIYRPFCRAACPIGLILGWISKIPGALIIGLEGDCKGCKSCSNACKIDAIHRYNKYSVLDNKECTVCGDCLDSCKQHGFVFLRKSKQHQEKVVCERENSN